MIPNISPLLELYEISFNFLAACDQVTIEKDVQFTRSGNDDYIYFKCKKSDKNGEKYGIR